MATLSLCYPYREKILHLVTSVAFCLNSRPSQSLPTVPCIEFLLDPTISHTHVQGCAVFSSILIQGKNTKKPLPQAVAFLLPHFPACRRFSGLKLGRQKIQNQQNPTQNTVFLITIQKHSQNTPNHCPRGISPTQLLQHTGSGVYNQGC